MTELQLAALRRLWPQECARVTADADRVLQHIFLFDAPWDMEQTAQPVQLAGDIDWQRCPAQDEEWTFMLARHGFVRHLAQAWALTGNTAYAQKAFTLIEDFTRRAPLTQAAKATTWRSLDAAIRVGNWLEAWALLRACPCVPEGFEEYLRNAVQQHAAYLYAVDTVFCRLSNWGVIGNAGLYHAALFLGRADWAAAARTRLADEAALQILPDGWHWEQSPMYHAEVMLSYLKVVRLARDFGDALPPALPRAVQSMCHAFAKSARPNHRQFLQSDSDDTDVRDLVTRGGVLFADAALKALGYPHADYETLFLALPEECAAYEALIPAPPQAAVEFAHSGNYYLRTGWGENETCTHFRCGCLGSGHGHADLLHVDVSAHGADVLVDSGRYSYVECPERLWLKSAEAHNTILVDGAPFTQCTDTWGYGQKAMPIKGSFFCDGEWMLAEGAHLGYHTLQSPVLLQRTVVQLGTDITFVLDVARTQGAHAYTRHFHFGPDGALSLSQETGAARWDAPQCTAQLVYLPTEAGRVHSTLYAPHYNRLAQKPTLTLQSEAHGTQVLPAVLVIRKGLQTAALTEAPVTSEKTSEPISRALARAYTVSIDGAPAATLLLALEECIRGVDLLRAGPLCGYGRVVVCTGARQATLAW